MATITLDSLDLAALLCSRVCHDVISPVGAIVNGLEVLEDDKRRLHARLRPRPHPQERQAGLGAAQFARLAFGAAGSAGASIDLGDAEQVARGMFQDEKVTFHWTAPRLLFPKNRVKLLLNLVMTATNAPSRAAARSASTVTGDAESLRVHPRGQGPNARIPPMRRPCSRANRRAAPWMLTASRPSTPAWSPGPAAWR